jgi:signal transduction histidine kinase
MRHPTFWLVFSAAALINAVWWFALQFMPGHDSAFNYAFNLVYGVPFLLAGVYLLLISWRWRRQRYPDTKAMAFFAVNYLLYAAAQACWTYYNFNLDIEIPSPAIPDIFYASSAFLQISACGVLFWHRLKPSGLPRHAGPILGALVVLATVAVSWALVGIIESHGDGVFTLDQFYLATSLQVGILVLVNMHRQWHAELRLFLYVTFLGVVANGFGNLLYGIRAASGSYWNGDVSDGVFALSGLLFLLTVGFIPEKLTHEEKEEIAPWRRPEALIPSAILVIALLVAANVAQNIYERGRESVGDEARFETTLLSDALQLSANEQLTRLSALAGFFSCNEVVDEAEFSSFLSSLRLADPAVSRFGFVDPNGTILFAQDESLIGNKDYATDPTRRALLEQAQRLGTVVVSDPLILLIGEPGVILVQPVFHDGEYRGSAIAAVRLAYFLASAEEFVLEGDEDFRLSTQRRFISMDGQHVYDREGYEIVDVAGTRSPDIRYHLPATVGMIEETTVVSFAGSGWVLRGMVLPAAMRTVYLAAVGVFVAILAVMFAFAAIVYLILGQRAQLQRELAKKSRQLTQFVSLVAHQLRAPMTQLRWMAEHLALSGNHLSKETKETLAQMENIAAAEAKLVADLLNISRLERGVLKLDFERVGLDKLAGQIIEPFLKPAEERQIRLVLEPSLDETAVRVDKEKVTEAIRNIVDNAVKYSPHGSTVRLAAAEKTAGQAVLTVADEGPGIPEEIQGTLFDIKQAAPGAGAASTGLGMYLCKQFIEAVGGSVRFETGPRGTTFFVSLPRNGQ